MLILFITLLTLIGCIKSKFAEYHEFHIDQVIPRGEIYDVPNGTFTLEYGNAFIYDSNNETVWRTETRYNFGIYLVFQTDGNLVLSDQRSRETWSSRTGEMGATRLVFTNNLKLVIYDIYDIPIWYSGSGMNPYH